jgi:hypothetical protein
MLTKQQFIALTAKLIDTQSMKCTFCLSFHTTSRGDKVIIHFIPTIAEKKNYTKKTLYWSPIRGWVEKLIDKK